MKSKSKIEPDVIYVLMEDDHGGTFSSNSEPSGHAVKTEAEAESWVSRFPATRSYERVRIIEINLGK